MIPPNHKVTIDDGVIVKRTSIIITVNNQPLPVAAYNRLRKRITFYSPDPRAGIQLVFDTATYTPAAPGGFLLPGPCYYLFAGADGIARLETTTPQAVYATVPWPTPINPIQLEVCEETYAK